MTRTLALLLPAALACTAPLEAAPTGASSADAGTGANAPSVSVMDLALAKTPVVFEVPRGALGFSLAMWTPTGSERAVSGVRELRDPAGRSAVVDFVPQGGARPLGQGVRGAAAVTSSWGINDGPVAGPWSVLAEGPEGSSLRLLVQRTDDGQFHGGLMDLELFVPDGLLVGEGDVRRPIGANDAVGDPAIAARVDAFFALLWVSVGISRGTVTTRAMEARYAAAESGDARAELLRQAAPSQPGTVAVALTNRMSYTDGAPLYGYTLGLPGFADPGGGTRAAIAVALYPESSAENDAVTMLHELGHFAGLMHTSEDDGTDDLLLDTPTCAPKARACLDTNNLMAPSGPKNTPELTASQRRVMQSAPIYRAFPRVRGESSP
ncbi:MAG: hypothetical protein IPG50_13895 [Myxococcales bacterium]|nr:hypothetical protein [Myxococcales bacterium]